MKARMSSLPVLQFCGKSAETNLGSGRAAAMGTAFHAMCAGSPDAGSLFAALSDEEQDEVRQWRKPADVTFTGGPTLAYSDARTEVSCGVDALGCPTEHGADEAVAHGTADMYWFVGDVLYVGDIKRSHWTTPDGADSLQLHGYALALVGRHPSARAYRLGIWAAVEGEWEWGPEVDLLGPVAAMAWARIIAAAANMGREYNRGTHCQRCYGRSRCPAYLIDPGTINETLGGLLSADLTEQTALELLRVVERAEDTLEVAKDRVKQFAREHGGVRDGASVWRPTQVKGRMSLDRRALEKDHPELVQTYTKQGAPYDVFKWVKAR